MEILKDIRINKELHKKIKQRVAKDETTIKDFVESNLEKALKEK